MNTLETCPLCKEQLPADAPKGLCPKCLLKEAGPEAFLSSSGFRPPLNAQSFKDHPELRNFGDYELIEELGRGGMGVVFKARQKSLNRLVALKMVSMGRIPSEEAIDRFRSEAEAAARLQHPNIVVIHEFGEVNGFHYFSMEFVEGPTMSAFRLQQPNKVIAWDYLAPLMWQLCDALEYAHSQKVIHRDLKPSNMMVDRHGRLKLADFGLAAVVAEVSSMTGLQPSSGTLTHMSPQQLDGRTPRITDDVYSVGATLYELLTGRPPFYTGDVLHQVRHVMPEPVEERLEALGIKNEAPSFIRAMIMACLAKDPAQRPQSAQDIRDWLQSKKATAMRLTCPHCSQTLEISSKLAGQNLLCPTCQNEFAVPAIPKAITVAAPVATPAVQRGHSKGLLASLAVCIVILLAVVVTLVLRKLTDGTAASGMSAAPLQALTQPATSPPTAPSSDFVELFNGRDLTGWSGAPGIWKVQNGLLIGDNSANLPKGVRGHIHWTNGVVGDFELRFAFRVPTGISGLIYRSQDFGEGERFGYEFVITDQKRDYSEIGQLFESGAKGSRPAWVPGRGHLGKPGEKVRVEPGRRIIPDGTPQATIAQAIRAVKLDHWNEGVIIAQGRRLTHLVNGVVVTEVDDREAMPDRLSGAIGFKIASNSRAEFKDIRLTNLGANGQRPSAAATPVSASPQQDPVAASASASTTRRTALFNGKDLSGWEARLLKSEPGRDPGQVFSVKDGLLRVSGREQGYLLTKETFSDYKLTFEYRWGEGLEGNSGVFLNSEVLDNERWARCLELDLRGSGVGGVWLLRQSELTVNGESKKAGWSFAQLSTLPDPQKPTGEWNRGTVLATEDRLVVEINGVRIVDGNRAQPTAGKIGLQSDKGELFFRNIYIEQISSEEEKQNESLTIEAPLKIDWQQTFGGSAHDEFASIQEVPGGGYLLAGSSSSPASGNKSSASLGSMDWWVVCVDEKGNKIWEKSFGGSGSDLLKRMQPLRSGGFLLYGFTESPADGNKISSQFGKGDGWLIRIDLQGEKLWEKAFGGSDWDNINDLREMSNGDLILAMRSASTISGNKSSPNFGSHDGVLLRLNSKGERKWEHSFGGPGADGFECVRELSDGDFIIGGFSGSQTPGGNMTARPSAAFDQWAMRVDRNGSKIWERILGGEKAESLFDVNVTDSGLVLLSGGAMSAPGGEKSGPAYGDMDIWLVQMDVKGTKLWDQTYGGLDFDGRARIAPYADGYLIAGPSKSGKSGNKTTESFGKLDFWLLGISQDGVKRWEQSFGGSDEDELLSVIPTRDGGFLVAGTSASPADGNKTAPNFGAKDAWVVKLSPNAKNRAAQNTAPVPPGR